VTRLWAEISINRLEDLGIDGRIIIKQGFKNTMGGYGWTNIAQNRGH
jgi:hypothetical protein